MQKLQKKRNKKEISEPVEIAQEKMQEPIAASMDSVTEVEQEDELDVPDFVSYSAPVHETSKKAHARSECPNCRNCRRITCDF